MSLGGTESILSGMSTYTSLSCGRPGRPDEAVSLSLSTEELSLNHSEDKSLLFRLWYADMDEHIKDSDVTYVC